MTDEQYQEIFSTLKALETRIGFIEGDLQELKDGINTIGDGMIGLAVSVSGLGATTSAPDTNKASKLAEFQKETARW
jgi:hypothetical protein